MASRLYEIVRKDVFSDIETGPSLHCNWRKSLSVLIETFALYAHDDVIKWKHFPRYWPFVRGIHRSPVNSRHKGQWRGALMFYLICARINGWVNNGEAGDLTRNRTHYDVIVMKRPLVTLWQGFTSNHHVCPVPVRFLLGMLIFAIALK